MTRPPVLMLDKQLLAARTMLAALEAMEPRLAEASRQLGNTTAWPLLRQCQSAIAQAKAAGINTGED